VQAAAAEQLLVGQNGEAAVFATAGARVQLLITGNVERSLRARFFPDHGQRGKSGKMDRVQFPVASDLSIVTVDVEDSSPFSHPPDANSITPAS